MRRFIQVAAVAGLLMPVAAFGQSTGSSEAPTSGNQPTSGEQQAGTEAAATSPVTPAATTTASTQADTTQSATTTTPSTARPAQLPFRNSILLWDHSVTPETIFRGSQLTAVSSYQWWFSFRPRWYFTPSLSLRARADLTIEWTDGGSETTLARQPELGDIWTDLVYAGYPELAGIKFSTGLRALWPLSLASRARGTIVSLGATVGATRAFTLPGHGGDINLGLSFAGTHAFTAYSNPGVATTYACGSLDPNVPSICDSEGGPMNAAFNLMSILTLGYNAPLQGLSVNLMYLLANAWAYAPPAATIQDPMAGTVHVQDPADRTYMRQNQWFLASVDYEVMREVSLSVGYYCYRPVLNPDSTYGNPFWAPGGTSRIFFTITAQLDGIWQTIRGVPRNNASTHARNSRPASGQTNQLARDLRSQQIMSGTF